MSRSDHKIPLAGQTLLTIILEATTTDMSQSDKAAIAALMATATNPKILYKTPGGTASFWTATISGTTLNHPMSAGEIDPGNPDHIGGWTFQIYFEVGSLKAYGEEVTHQFYKPLDA